MSYVIWKVLYSLTQCQNPDLKRIILTDIIAFEILAYSSWTAWPAAMFDSVGGLFEVGFKAF